MVILGGSIGYYIIFKGEPSFIDCIYMTVISLTTVGYGEVIPVTGNNTAQLFTMVLITFGGGVLLYGISTLTALLIEGELSGLLRTKQMQKQIEQLREHYIVCGGGQTGLPLMVELIKNSAQVVLIELNETQIERARGIGEVPYIRGDATDDHNLLAAGIERASGIFTCLPSDKDNLYITMTARMYNKKIRIISRMIDEKIRPKLLKAGADGVVSPSAIGALRMASEMIRPTAVDFLDRMLRSQRGNLRIHQLTVSTESAKVGKTLAESDIEKRFNLLILGAKESALNGEIEFNPPPTQRLEPGMTLIVMGEVENIVRAQKDF